MLQLNEVTKIYPSQARPALDRVTLSVGPGEFIALIGLSGAGKSTLIRCINRLVEPTSGRITWNGEDILALDGKALRTYRQKIGMIFQSFQLIEQFSVLTNVLIGFLGKIPAWRASILHFTKAEIEQAEEALARVGLADWKDQRVSQLSGGQRQRVAIARCLVQKPQLILGDEPISSLDPVNGRRVMDLLKSINQEDQTTMLVNLHDIEIAKRYATRIIGLSRGKVVFDSTPDQLTEEALERIYHA